MNDDLVRTSLVFTRAMAEKCRDVGGGNQSKGAALLIQGGIDALNGAGTVDLDAVELAEVLAHRLRERRLAPVTVSGSGAALLSNPAPHRIDALLQQGAGVVVTRAGLLVPGATPDGADALLVLDLDAGKLAISAAGAGAEVELGESLPALGSLASLVSGTLTRCWETVSGGREPAEAPQGQRPDWGLVIWASSAQDDGHSRVQLGTAAIVVHSLQLLQLASELYGLLARRSAATLAERAELEQLLTRPSVDSPAVALAWSRTHGEG